VDVDLGAVSLHDARAVRIALQVAIDSGYFTSPENITAVLAFKALVQHRIALAERENAA
jgi:hypothetical protein